MYVVHIHATSKTVIYIKKKKSTLQIPAAWLRTSAIVCGACWSSPTQLRPSGAGSYPWAHVQRKEPGRFSHHPGEQGLPSEHSLISAGRSTSVTQVPYTNLQAAKGEAPLSRARGGALLPGGPPPAWSLNRPHHDRPRPPGCDSRAGRRCT